MFNLVHMTHFWEEKKKPSSGMLIVMKVGKQNDLKVFGMKKQKQKKT